MDLPDARAGNAEWPYRTRRAHHYALQFAYRQRPKTYYSARTLSTACSSSAPTKN